MPPPDPDTVRCPTCRVAQPWSDACRRCKSDFTLIRRFSLSYHRHRASCLRHIRSGRPLSAASSARHCHAISPSADSRRLLSLSSLLDGDWATAAGLGLVRED